MEQLPPLDWSTPRVLEEFSDEQLVELLDDLKVIPNLRYLRRDASLMAKVEWRIGVVTLEYGRRQTGGPVPF